MKHSPCIIKGFFKSHGIPTPEFEYIFAEELGRKWRFDICWPVYDTPKGQKFPYVAVEIQGGIFIQGRHSRGAAMLKEWEKLNAAACLGWRLLYCQPKDLLTAEMASLIKHALGI